MRKRQLLFGANLALIMISLAAADGFSQAQAAQNRIPQQVVINGQTVNAVHVVAAGGNLQSYTCPNPQQYTAPDQSSQGWACYEQATGTWLLNALPPSQTPVQAQVQPPPAAAPQQQPAVIYQQPAPTVIYTTPGYPTYPVVVAPAYPPSVVLGAAAIGAAGRIISAAIIGSHYPRFYYGPAYGFPGRGRR